MPLLARVNRVPPKLVRFLAWKQHQRRPLTNEEIAHLSGLARSTVAKISTLAGWGSVRIKTADAFARACGVDLDSPPGVVREMFARRIKSMGRARVEQRRMFARLLAGLSN